MLLLLAAAAQAGPYVATDLNLNFGDAGVTTDLAARVGYRFGGGGFQIGPETGVRYFLDANELMPFIGARAVYTEASIKPGVYMNVGFLNGSNPVTAGVVLGLPLADNFGLNLHGGITAFDSGTVPHAGLNFAFGF